MTGLIDALFSAPTPFGVVGLSDGGPDGFPYLVLDLPISGEVVTLRDTVAPALEAGAGVLVQAGGQVEYVVPFGRLWALAEWGTTDPAAEAPRAPSSAEMRTSAPDDAVLPPYARRALAGVLRAHGVEPKVIVVRDDGVPPMSLMFPTTDPALLDRLRWYLPPHYGLLPSLHAFEDEMVPLLAD